jgi:hypothetical protein
MHNHEIEEPVIQGDHLSWSAIVQRIAIGVAGAAIFGAGSVMINTTSTVHEHEARISILEKNLAKVPEIDKNVVVLNGKVDVLNQKLDDAKDALKVRANERVR